MNKLAHLRNVVALVALSLLITSCRSSWDLVSVTVNSAPLGGSDPVSPVTLIAPSQQVVDMSGRIRRQGFNGRVFFEALLTLGSQSGWSSPFRIEENRIAGNGPLMRVTCAQNGANADLSIVFSRQRILAHEAQQQTTTFSVTGAPAAVASIDIRAETTDARRSGGPAWNAPHPLLVSCRLPIPVPVPSPSPVNTPIN
jgi:hypothetical protein